MGKYFIAKKNKSIKVQIIDEKDDQIVYMILDSKKRSSLSKETFFNSYQEDSFTNIAEESSESKKRRKISDEDLDFVTEHILKVTGITPETIMLLNNIKSRTKELQKDSKGDLVKPVLTTIITIGDNGNWYIDGNDTGNKAQGDPGKPGRTPAITIGDNGNWYIDGNDTGKKSQGDSGKPGHTPVITIGENGSWIIDGKDTGKKAQVPFGESVPVPGPKGDKGDKGDPGHSPVISIRNGNWIIDGKDTGCAAQGPKGESYNTGFSGNSVKEFEIRNLKRTDINYLIDQILHFGANRLKGPQGPQGPKGAPGVKGKVSPFIWVVIILLFACILYLGYSNYSLNEKIDKISNELISNKTPTPDNFSSATTQYPDTSNTSVHDSLSMDSKDPVIDYSDLLAQANRTVQTQKKEIRELKKRNKNLEDALKKITDKKS